VDLVKVTLPRNVTPTLVQHRTPFVPDTFENYLKQIKPIMHPLLMLSQYHPVSTVVALSRKRVIRIPVKRNSTRWRKFTQVPRSYLIFYVLLLLTNYSRLRFFFFCLLEFYLSITFIFRVLACNLMRELSLALSQCHLRLFVYFCN
jgi:hypothetical protein